MPTSSSPFFCGSEACVKKPHNRPPNEETANADDGEHDFLKNVENEICFFVIWKKSKFYVRLYVFDLVNYRVPRTVPFDEFGDTMSPLNGLDAPLLRLARPFAVQHIRRPRTGIRLLCCQMV
jgi:hypothetical protein